MDFSLVSEFGDFEIVLRLMCDCVLVGSGCSSNVSNAFYSARFVMC